MKPLGRKLIMIGIIFALLIPGCYTVIKHPKDEGAFLANQTSDCVSCHAGYTEFPYGHYYSPSPDYWWNHPRYGEFYTFPWWWSYYEYSYLDGRYKYDTYSNQGETKFDEHEALVYPPPPPYSIPYSPGGGYYLPGPVIVPQYGGSGNGAGTGSSSRPNSNQDGSRSRDGSSEVKETRQSTTKATRPTPREDNSSSTTQESKPAPEKETKEGKKKSRRGGGGSGGGSRW